MPTAKDIFITKPANRIATVVSGIANFFGLNIKEFDKLYDRSAALREKVDRLAEDYLRKYEDKLATSTPSTSPSLARFVTNQLEKDKDVVLAMQRKVQALTDDIERDRNKVNVDFNRRDKFKQQVQQAEEIVNNDLKSLSNSKTTSAIIHGAQDKFANAQQVQKWKETTNAQKKL